MKGANNKLNPNGKENEKMGKKKIVRNAGQHKVEDLRAQAAEAGVDISKLVEAGLLDEAANKIDQSEKLKAAEAKKTGKAIPKNRWERLWTKIDREIKDLGVEDCEILMAMKYLTLKEGEGGGSSDWGHKAGLKAALLAYRHAPECLSKAHKAKIKEMIKDA